MGQYPLVIYTLQMILGGGLVFVLLWRLISWWVRAHPIDQSDEAVEDRCW